MNEIDCTLMSVSDALEQGHIGPGFSDALRAELLSVLGSLGLPSPVRNEGVYCLTSGPRFETKAESALRIRYGSQSWSAFHHSLCPNAQSARLRAAATLWA